MEISFHRQANRLPHLLRQKRLIQQGGAGGFACRSHGHNQWSASELNKFPKTVMHPATTSSARARAVAHIHGRYTCTRERPCRASTLKSVTEVITSRAQQTR